MPHAYNVSVQAGGGRAMSWALAGVAIDSAGVVGGTELTPAALRGCSRLQRMVAVDHGDLAAPVHDKRRDPRSGLVGHREVVAATGKIRSAFIRWLEPGRRTVVLGGCCTLMIGLGAATRDKVGPFASDTSTATSISMTGNPCPGARGRTCRSQPCWAMAIRRCWTQR